MQDRFLLAVIAMLFCMALIWLVLVSQLFASLRERHARTYVFLGSPSLFLNNTPKTTYAFLRFLLARHYRQLNDPPLEHLCKFLVVFFFVYLVLLIGGISLVLV